MALDLAVFCEVYQRRTTSSSFIKISPSFSAVLSRIGPISAVAASTYAY